METQTEEVLNRWLYQAYVKGAGCFTYEEWEKWYQENRDVILSELSDAIDADEEE